MPSNTSAATAMVLSPLPVSLAQAVTSGTDLWYVYTPTPGDTALSFWAYGQIGVYHPRTFVYTGSPSALSPYLAGSGLWGTNVAIQVPVTFGTTYYFKVESLTDGTATVNVRRAPRATAPMGSLFIPDDSDGYPAVILDQVTGRVLRFVHPFPPGEAGDVLDDGTIAVGDYVNNAVQIYGPDLAHVATVAHDVLTAGGSIRTNKAADVWYAVRSASSSVVKRILRDGTVTDTWTLTSKGDVDCLASSNDEATLYFTRNAGGSTVIETWDLVGDAAGPDFVTDATFYRVFDILVMPDTGDVVMPFVLATASPHAEVRVYDAAGVLLRTIDMGTDHDFPAGTMPRMAYAIDPDEVWFWTHLDSDDGISRFSRIKVSTGEILHAFNAPEFESGAYISGNTSNPENVHGHSFSCPLLALRAPIVTILVDESIPCCDSGGGCDCPPSPVSAPTGSPSSAPIPTSTGPVTPPVNTLPESGAPTPLDPPFWDALCVGAGTVPTESDPVDYESWVRH